jgi:WD40 repeat protein
LLHEWDANALPKKATVGNAAQLVNPAYVHAVAVSADGRSVAAAIGDGRVALTNDSKDMCVVEAHSAAASTCAILDDKLKSFVVSGGNDSRVRVFRKRIRSTTGSQRIALDACVDHAHSAKVNFVLGELAPVDWSGRLFIAGSAPDIAVGRVIL